MRAGVGKAVATAAKRVARRMTGGGGGCPPGVWCMDSTTMVLAAVLCVLVVAAFVVAVVRASWPSVRVFAAPPAPAPPAPTLHLPPPIIHVRSVAVPVAVPGGMLPPPQRAADMPPDPAIMEEVAAGAAAGGTPVWQPTRGWPQAYQQVGVLAARGGGSGSGSGSDGATRTLLPLLGRKVSARGDRWNYYTRTDGTNPVQVPVAVKGRGCDEDVGCEEVMDGDSVSVPLLGAAFAVSMYRAGAPRYIG